MNYQNNNNNNNRDLCHYRGKQSIAHRIFILKLNVPNKIPVVFHNHSTYSSHFITKEFANEVEGKFDCLRENTEKYKTSSIPVEK